MAAWQDGAAGIEARPEAALNGSYGLELRVDDTAVEPAADAYVAIGSDKGLLEERRLEVGLSLDPSGLEVTGRAGQLPFLRLSQTLEPATARLVLALSRTSGTAWNVAAWSWKDATAAYVLAGQAPLQRDGTGPVRLQLRWSSEPGRPGSLQLMRDDGPGQQALLIDNPALDNGAQYVGAVHVGALAADPRGVAGRLALDELQLARIAGPRLSR